MQGRHEPDEEFWDKYVSQRMPAVGETGKQRALPQRPPGLPRVKEPPPSPRVGRPKRRQRAGNTKQRLFTWGCLGLVVIVLAFFGTYAAINLLHGVQASAGPSTTATDFLSAIESQNYQKAYSDLGPGITLRLTQDQFAQQAQLFDSCYGKVKNYTEVANSAVYQNDNSQSYKYTLERTKSKSYQLPLTIQRNPTSANTSWQISDFGDTLGPPGASPTSCK